MTDLERRIRRAIRKDPHTTEICDLLGVTLDELLDGLGTLAGQNREEDLCEAEDRTEKARAAVGASKE